MKLLRSIALFILNLATALTLIAANAAPAGIHSKHCYALLSPANENSGSASQILETACFDTFSQAMQAATLGRGELDPSTRPQDVTDEMLTGDNDGVTVAAMQVVIGIDYDYASYGGSSYTWVANDYGCSATIQYGVTIMPAGWDNRVSSAKGYSNCNYDYHYQNTNYNGSSIACHDACPSMGLWITILRQKDGPIISCDEGTSGRR